MSLTSIIVFFLILTLITLPISGIAAPFNITLPGCPDKCGNISIPYPFGISPGCYLPGFDLLCSNNSSTTPVLSMGLGNPNASVLIQNINLTTGEANALQYINYRCFDQSNNVESNNTFYLNLIHFPAYLFSAKRNKFTVIGCYTLAYMNAQSQKDKYHAGCLSFCSGWNSTTNGPCDGRGCCQASIPEGLNFYSVQWGFNHNLAWDFNPCNYAVLMEEDSYNLTVPDLEGENFETRNKGRVPFVLDWAIRSANDICLDSGDASACLSQHSTCYNTTNGQGYLCQCIEGFDGNPYIHDGCHDINECENPKSYECLGTCTNTYGSYDCKCPKGTEGDGKTGKCYESFPRPARVAIVSILVVAILMALCFLVNAYRHKKRYNKEKEEHRRYYEMMAPSLRVYTAKEITEATNNFDENQVIGAGGHGKVYKGVLENNEEVAIKKSKKFEEIEREEFDKEIILLSQINHKNIVRILGCCLEVKIPMLVYEFVAQGSLFDLLHRKKNKSIPLATRIKIGLGSAEALHYLHDSISPSILHADVKSANILLNGSNTAKVSDFGASKPIVNDADFISLVQGTRGYLDPECFSTQEITKSSDVYSFGVVLAELLTRKKATYTDETNDNNYLASSFISMVNKNKMLEMLDKEIVSDDAMVIEILREVSELVLWCLSFKGDDRPTMKQVVEKLQSVVKLNRDMFNLEDTENLLDNTFSYGYKSPNTSTFHITGSSSVSQPLDGQFGTPR